MNKEEQEIFAKIQRQLGTPIEQEIDVDEIFDYRIDIEDADEFCSKGKGHTLYSYTWAEPITEEEYYRMHVDYTPMKLDDISPVEYCKKEDILSSDEASVIDIDPSSIYDYIPKDEKIVMQQSLNEFCEKTLDETLTTLNKMVDLVNRSLPSKAKPFIPYTKNDGYAKILYFEDNGTYYIYSIGEESIKRDREYDDEGNFYLSGMTDREKYKEWEVQRAKMKFHRALTEFRMSLNLPDKNKKNGIAHHKDSMALIEEMLKSDNIDPNIKGTKLNDKVAYYYDIVEPEGKRGYMHVTKKEIKDLILASI